MGERLTPLGGPRPAVREDDGRLTRGKSEDGRFVPFEMREGERERVLSMAKVLTPRQIGLLLRDGQPVSESTIKRHFPEELALGRAQAVSGLAESLYTSCFDADGNLTDKKQASWLLERLGDPGQFAPQRLELTGPGGGPIQTVDVAALAGLDDDKLSKLGELASIVASLAGADTAGPATLPDAAGPDTSGTSAASE